MNITGWEVIKDFYQKTFGIDGWIVEMYANLDIISLCVSGASTNTISRFLELPISEIVQATNQVFEFEGWERDLPINPYRVFCLYDGQKGTVEHYTSFISDVGLELNNQKGFEDTKPDKLFQMCKVYAEIEERILNEWI